MMSRMRQVLDSQLHELVTTGTRADLISRLVEPLAARVVFEFAGIPPQDWDWVRQRSYQIRARDARTGTARAEDSLSALRRYVRELLELKAHCPGRDALSEAARLAASDSEDTDVMLDCVSMFNLIDYDVLAARLGYGLLFLLRHRTQLDLMLGDRSLVPGAVEEVLRMAVPGGSWIPRYAGADIDYPGAPIRAGELVVFSMQSANNDPEAFEDPGRLDITRAPNQHMAFGHGKFNCLGAHISRCMLRVAFEGIFERLPRLRLAVSPEEIRLEDRKVTGGLRQLPAAWD
jgi:pentalenolactone synthase